MLTETCRKPSWLRRFAPEVGHRKWVTGSGSRGSFDIVGQVWGGQPKMLHSPSETMNSIFFNTALAHKTGDVPPTLRSRPSPTFLASPSNRHLEVPRASNNPPGKVLHPSSSLRLESSDPMHFLSTKDHPTGALPCSNTCHKPTPERPSPTGEPHPASSCQVARGRADTSADVSMDCCSLGDEQSEDSN